MLGMNIHVTGNCFVFGFFVFVFLFFFKSILIYIRSLLIHIRRFAVLFRGLNNKNRLLDNDYLNILLEILAIQ